MRLRRLVSAGLGVLMLGKRFITWTIEYTGPFAALVKAIPVMLMAVFITFPLYTYPLWLMWAQAMGEPGCYFIYALWWLMFFTLALCASVLGYLREKR